MKWIYLGEYGLWGLMQSWSTNRLHCIKRSCDPVNHKKLLCYKIVARNEDCQFWSLFFKPVWNEQIAWYLQFHECSVCSQKSRLATSQPHKFMSRKVIKQAKQAFRVTKWPTERGGLVLLAVSSFAFRVSLRSSCCRFLSAKWRLEKVREARSPQRTGAKTLRLGGRCEDLARFPLG